MKKIIKKIILKTPIISTILKFYFFIKGMNSRINFLEQRLQNHRWYAIEEVMGYLVGAQIPGEYCEFGVFKGDTFGHAFKIGSPALPSLRFIAFDSFEGLPDPKGIDKENGYASNFHKGEFACSEEIFKQNLQTVYKVDLAKVTTVPGWFDKSLTKQTADQISLNRISAAWIDCDFYESCVPVLDFITDKISIGSVIIFDDWHVYRNLPDRGVQKACAEWLKKNPKIKLTPLFSYAHYGEVFTVCEI